MRIPTVRVPTDWTRIGAALLVVALASACSDSTESPLVPDTPTFLQLQEGDLAAAVAAQAQYGPGLMDIEGVVGHGVGIGADGQPSVVVFTVRPGVTGIPAQVEGVPTRTVASGMFVALADETARVRPAPLGFSIGHPDITAGTLGFKVKDASGNAFILSNNHVIANANDANVGDNILQPGPSDGGSDPADKIGTLADYVPMDFNGGDNVVDAAIASVVSSDVLSSTSTEGYGQPTATTVAASVNMAVQKYGRTTGHTAGSVDAINATVDVCYEARGPFRCVKLARFVDQIIITPGDFSAGGDSGSGIVDGNLNPVGLLFAGSPSYTIANPIAAVLAAFGVTIDDGSGTGGDDLTNIAPTAVADAYDATAGTTLVVPAPGVLANDEDVDGDPLTAMLVDGPLNATSFNLSDDGSFSYGSSTVGEDSFTYYASDGTLTSSTVTVTITVSEPTGALTVTGIDPNSATAGTAVEVTITGTGFAAGASVAFENGGGPAPDVSNVTVGDATTISATVTIKSGGPPRSRVWDVRVTNPDGSSALLPGGFTVNP